MRIVPVHASALGNSDSSFFVPDNKFYIQLFLMSYIQKCIRLMAIQLQSQLL